jgi:DNA (cytosine-5)-methyltransferase 1
VNVLDLFSGIGGFSLGLERAGMRTVAFCEIDPYCRAVLAKHWPGVPIHHDVTKLTAADVRGVDVICGGFPCQDISAAGEGAGLEGERSGLWREYARLVSDIRPRFVIVENVAALAYRGLLRVLGDLADIGYDAEWHCIPASAVGAPHLRERFWIVAYPGGVVGHRPLLTKDSAQLGGQQAIGGEDWELFALVPGVPTGCGRWREMGEPGLVPEDDGLPGVLGRLRAYGNAVVPQIPEIIGRAIMQAEGITA